METSQPKTMPLYVRVVPNDQWFRIQVSPDASTASVKDEILFKAKVGISDHGIEGKAKSRRQQVAYPPATVPADLPSAFPAHMPVLARVLRAGKGNRAAQQLQCSHPRVWDGALPSFGFRAVASMAAATDTGARAASSSSLSGSPSSRGQSVGLSSPESLTTRSNPVAPPKAWRTDSRSASIVSHVSKGAPSDCKDATRSTFSCSTSNPHSLGSAGSAIDTPFRSRASMSHLPRQTEEPQIVATRDPQRPLLPFPLHTPQLSRAMSANFKSAHKETSDLDDGSTRRRSSAKQQLRNVVGSLSPKRSMRSLKEMPAAPWATSTSTATASELPSVPPLPKAMPSFHSDNGLEEQPADFRSELRGSGHVSRIESSPALSTSELLLLSGDEKALIEEMAAGVDDEECPVTPTWKKVPSHLASPVQLGIDEKTKAISHSDDVLDHDHLQQGSNSIIANSKSESVTDKSRLTLRCIDLLPSQRDFNDEVKVHRSTVSDSPLVESSSESDDPGALPFRRGKNQHAASVALDGACSEHRPQLLQQSYRRADCRTVDDEVMIIAPVVSADVDEDEDYEDDTNDGGHGQCETVGSSHKGRDRSATITAHVRSQGGAQLGVEDNRCGNDRAAVDQADSEDTQLGDEATAAGHTSSTSSPGPADGFTLTGLPSVPSVASRHPLASQYCLYSFSSGMLLDDYGTLLSRRVRPFELIEVQFSNQKDRIRLPRRSSASSCSAALAAGIPPPRSPSAAAILDSTYTCPFAQGWVYICRPFATSRDKIKAGIGSWHLRWLQLQGQTLSMYTKRPGPMAGAPRATFETSSSSSSTPKKRTLPTAQWDLETIRWAASEQALDTKDSSLGTLTPSLPTSLCKTIISVAFASPARTTNETASPSGWSTQQRVPSSKAAHTPLVGGYGIPPLSSAVDIHHSIALRFLTPHEAHAWHQIFLRAHVRGLAKRIGSDSVSLGDLCEGGLVQMDRKPVTAVEPCGPSAVAHPAARAERPAVTCEDPRQAPNCSESIETDTPRREGSKALIQLNVDRWRCLALNRAIIAGRGGVVLSGKVGRDPTAYSKSPDAPRLCRRAEGRNALLRTRLRPVGADKSLDDVDTWSSDEEDEEIIQVPVALQMRCMDQRFVAADSSRSAVRAPSSQQACDSFTNTATTRCSTSMSTTPAWPQVARTRATSNKRPASSSILPSPVTSSDSAVAASWSDRPIHKVANETGF
ncbi:unnamed protein product [Jaminaea pallidilutea]